MEALRRAYFEWLYNRVKNERKDYLLLCIYLDKIPFRWTVHNDGNREQDAIRQRDIYINEEFCPYHSDDIDRFYKAYVSVFEVLVALCDRIDFNLDDMVNPPRHAQWFEELLRNLGISWAVDDEFKYRLGAKAEVDKAIDIFMDRRYDYNGNGSLFPLHRRPSKSMKTTEIWYQMMAYIDENY